MSITEKDLISGFTGEINMISQIVSKIQGRLYFWNWARDTGDYRIATRVDWREKADCIHFESHDIGEIIPLDNIVDSEAVAKIEEAYERAWQ